MLFAFFFVSSVWGFLQPWFPITLLPSFSSPVETRCSFNFLYTKNSIEAVRSLNCLWQDLFVQNILAPMLSRKTRIRLAQNLQRLVAGKENFPCPLGGYQGGVRPARKVMPHIEKNYHQFGQHKKLENPFPLEARLSSSISKSHVREFSQRILTWFYSWISSHLTTVYIISALQKAHRRRARGVCVQPLAPAVTQVQVLVR